MHTALPRKALVAALAFALSASWSVSAQTAAGDQPGDSATKKDTKALETVVVTGSRIARSEVEGPAPVQIITADELKSEGFTTVYEVMNSLTQSFRAETPPSWGSTTVNARQLNLRGLSPNHALLLIDGKRITDYPQPSGINAGYNFQNYNNIPTGMIDRIEVLATGASAIYGSDAVAGVVNIILKHKYDGDDVSLQAGRSERGERNLGDFNWTGGKSGENWSVVYNFEKSHRSALFGRDRPYTDAESDAGYGSWDSTARTYGYQSYPGIVLQNDQGNYFGTPAGACTQTGFQGFYRLQDGPQGSRCVQNAYFKDWVLTPGRDDTNGYVYGEYDFANGMKAYASVGLWRTTGISNTELPFLYPMGGIPNGFYDKTSGQIVTNYLRQLTAQEMGTSGNTYDREQNWNLNAGIKGTIFDDKFSWDASVGRSVYWVHESYTGLNEQGMFDYFFGAQQGTTTIGGNEYPVYALNSNRYFNPITPADYSTFGVNGRNDAISWMNQAQLTVSGSLFELPAGPLGVAAVVEANHQGFELYPDARGNTTTFGDPFQNYNTGGGERTRYSGATEFRIPVLSTLTATLAGRIDKYDDASNADVARTWAGSFEYRPITGLLFRGSYGTNFHAPDMIDIYKQVSASTVGIYSDPYLCIQAHDTTCAPVQHSTYYTSYSGGTPTLVPETGKNWTYGFVWDVPVVEGLSVAADYWRIRLNDVIQAVDQNQLLRDEAGCRTGLNVDRSPYTAHAPGSGYCQQVQADVIRDASGNLVSVTAGAVNISSVAVSGVDASVAYRWATEQLGDFRFNLNYTQNLSYYARTLATDPLVNTAYQNPRSRITASVNWQRENWDATLYGNRIGGVRAPRYGGCETLSDGSTPDFGAADCVVYKANIAPWITYNASVGYRFNEHAKLNFYVVNLFNRVGSIPYYAGGFEFISTINGADYNGREYSMKFDYKF